MGGKEGAPGKGRDLTGPGQWQGARSGAARSSGEEQSSPRPGGLGPLRALTQERDLATSPSGTRHRFRFPGDLEGATQHSGGESCAYIAQKESFRDTEANAGPRRAAAREAGERPRVPSAGAHSPRARTPRRRRHARAARTEGPGCRHVPACALEGPGRPRGAPRGLPGPAPIPDPLPTPRYQNPGPPRSLRTHSRPPCQQEPFSPHYSRDFLCYRRLI